MRLLIGVLLVVLVGCGLTPQQRQAVGTFSDATSTMASIGTDRLWGARDIVVKLRSEGYTLAYLGLRPYGSWDPTDPDLEGPVLTEENLSLREDALNALNAYAKALKALTTVNPRDDVPVALNRLFIATDSLNQNHNQNAGTEPLLSAAQKSAITKVAGSLAGLWADKKAKDTLELLIPTYTPAVNTLTELLTRDFVMRANSPCWPDSKAPPGLVRGRENDKAGINDGLCSQIQTYSEFHTGMWACKVPGVKPASMSRTCKVVNAQQDPSYYISRGARGVVLANSLKHQLAKQASAMGHTLQELTKAQKALEKSMLNPDDIVSADTLIQRVNTLITQSRHLADVF